MFRILTSHPVTILLLLWTLSTVGVAQERDYRAEMKVSGRLSEIGVTPSGTVWLGNVYSEFFVLPADSNTWQYGPSYKPANAEYASSPNSISQICFVTDEIGIATGYIYSDSMPWLKSGFYRTSDAGKTWSRRSLGDEVWVYCTFVDAQRGVWAGGSSGNLIHSRDQGLTWEVIPTPFGASKRLNAIYMDTTGNGILGALDDELVVTSDRGRTFRGIATPAEQLPKTNGILFGGRVRIQRVARWHSWYIVEQMGRVWYADTSTITWRTLPEPSAMFTIDEVDQRLYTVSTTGHVVVYDSTLHQMWQHTVPVRIKPQSIASSNGALFVQEPSGVVHIVREGASIRSVGLYTYAEGIKQPDLIRKGRKTSWGVTERSLYAMDDQEPQRWFRVAPMDGRPDDLTLVDDTTALVWTRGKNVRYTMNREQGEDFVPREPLVRFLKHPVVALQIYAVSQGCFHGTTALVRYSLQEDGSWVADSVSQSDTTLDRESGSVSTADVDAALIGVDQTPGQYPPLTAFRITPEDVAMYRSVPREESHPDSAYYERFIQSIDSLERADYVVPIPLYSEWYSTTSGTMVVTLTNGVGEQLTVTSDVYLGWAWGLPFDVNYSGLHFTSMSLDLARMIKRAMPSGFLFKDRFENWRLLVRLAGARYLGAR